MKLPIFLLIAYISLFANQTSREKIENFYEIKNSLKERFLEANPKLNIISVKISPRSSIDNVPKKFLLHLKSNRLLRSRGIFSISSQNNIQKRYFFNYLVEATYPALRALKTLKRGERVTANDIKSVIEPFNVMKSRVATRELLESYEIKNRVKVGDIIYFKQLKLSPIVKKRSTVNARIAYEGITIEFDAIAQKDGNMGSIIPIKKYDGTKLSARVIAPSTVEIE